MATPTIAAGALRKLLAYCAEVGVDSAVVLAEVEIDPAVLDDRDARVPIAKLHAMWNAVAARSGRSDGALLTAGHYRPGDYGLIGFVIMTCATMDDALGQFVRYIALWTDEPAFSREGSIVRAAYRHSIPDSIGKRIATESAFAEIVHAARMLTGARELPRAVRFAHPAPPDRSAHDRFFGCAVEFSAPAHELELQTADLALAFPQADPQLGEFLRESATRALARRDVPDDSPLSRARAIMADELTKCVPSLQIVARRMAISPRTLRRRLAEAGTSFRGLLDDTRAELARSYVRDRRIPLAEIAFLLGFSEPSTFHRAFKRWTRTTPAAWRAGS